MTELRVLSRQDEIAALASEWDALAARCGLSCFCGFAFAMAWLETARTLENVTCRIIALKRDGRLTGLLPLVAVRKKGLLILRWLGHDAGLGPLHLFETEDDRKKLWQAALTQTDCDVARFEYLFEGAPERALVLAASGARAARQDVVSLMVCHEQNEVWLRTLSAHARADYRRKKNALAKRGEITLTALRGQDIPYDLISRMLAFKKRWAEAAGKKALDLFASDDLASRLVRVGAQQGAAFVHELRCGAEVTSIAISYSRKDTLFWHILARDPAWDKYSVGTVLAVRLALWAGENGFKRIYLFEGTESYKARYAGEREPFIVGLAGLTFKGRLAVALDGLLCKIKRAAS